MDQMDEELAQTSIGESFEKVNMFLISSVAVLPCALVKLTTTANLYRGKLCNKTNQNSRRARVTGAVASGKRGKCCARQNLIKSGLHVIGSALLLFS